MTMEVTFNQYDKVQHLQADITEWTILVRAQAVWKEINRTTNELRGLNVIFIDDSNSRIHAFISAKIIDLFPDTVKEGCIYKLSNFHIRVYGVDDKSRSVRFEKHIYFANHSRLELQNENLTQIAPYAFDIFNISDVPKFTPDDRFLIDVVGLIEDTNIHCIPSKDDEKKTHIRFRIYDGRHSLSVTFFNTFGQEFEKALKSENTEQVFIVIASARVNQYEGNYCLNNYSSTRYYLNIDHYSIKALKTRLRDHKPSNIPRDKPQEVIPPLLTIAEIKKLGTEYTEKKVRCQITVKKVDKKTHWYDNVCTTCGEAVDISNARYKCVICARYIPYPDKRFRLGTICNDNTGILPVILPDDEIQRIIGKDVFDIENEEEEADTKVDFPTVLKVFEKKDYVLTLKISERNVEKSSNIYHATEISEPVEKLGSHNPTAAETNAFLDNSITSVIENTNEEMNNTPDVNGKTHDVSNIPVTIAEKSDEVKTNPPTAKSSNKVRQREKKDNHNIQIEDNVPIGKYKVVKTKKP